MPKRPAHLGILRRGEWLREVEAPDLRADVRREGRQLEALVPCSLIGGGGAVLFAVEHQAILAVARRPIS